ncbi:MULTISPECIES: hypothetical protein [unclassified Mycobacterium]|uniref:hypothetical protein n=1 Tax=unclassified Mycobacterium TaxID=2642494 RepID=UPI000B0ABF65|nr:MULTISPECIES: hypothetical protein [unclassified Mycobacterium]
MARRWRNRGRHAGPPQRAQAYERAFATKLADPDNGHLTWTTEEAGAWRTVSHVQTEQRVMSLTDNAGGLHGAADPRSG